MNTAIDKTIKDLNELGVDTKFYNETNFISDLKTDLLLVAKSNTRVQKVCMQLDSKYITDSCNVIESNKKLIAKAFTTKEATKNG